MVPQERVGKVARDPRAGNGEGPTETLNNGHSREPAKPAPGRPIFRAPFQIMRAVISHYAPRGATDPTSNGGVPVLTGTVRVTGEDFRQSMASIPGASGQRVSDPGRYPSHLKHYLPLANDGSRSAQQARTSSIVPLEPPHEDLGQFGLLRCPRRGFGNIEIYVLSHEGMQF